jgi:PAP2 superfamily
MRTLTALLCLSLAAVLLAPPAVAAQSGDHGPDLAIAWNEKLLAIAEEDDGFLTLKGVRTAAMMHIAMHDALNAVVRRFEPYADDERAPDADTFAAAAAAAFAVAADQFPGREPELRALLEESLAPIPDSAAKRAGLELGRRAASTILAARMDDDWDREAEYRWHEMGPGVYAEFHEHSDTPEGFVFGAGWAEARGFALASPGQFRVPPPPPIDSDEYTQAFNEVKEVGRFQTLERTPDQTHLALWWKDFAENSHNRLARDLAGAEHLALDETVRLFALVNMAIFDGYVGSFENKFFYNHWRPYTAIRWAANDGNPDTAPEATWTNLHRHTYAFPSYPSAHGTACGAAMTAFTDVFGEGYAFTMRNPAVDVAGPLSGKIEIHPPTRSFESFAAAARECSLSRLYLGIHFRYDSLEGLELGRRIGANVVGAKLTRTGD